MSEPKQLCTVLTLEKIAKYLGVTPNRARVALRNLAKTVYAIEIDPGKWVRVVNVRVARETPAPKPKLKPGEGLVAAADSARSVAELKQIRAAALTTGRIQ